MQAIRDAGGAVFGLTSEPQTLASEAVTSWELSFPSLGDPHHEIWSACEERGWLSVFVNARVGLWERTTGYANHPKGFFQPGVLVVSRTGRVLYRWRVRPTRRNLGGATERPVPEDVWRKVQQALADGPDAPDVPMDVPERVDSEAGRPWPYIVAVMLAHGNFLAPIPLPLTRGGQDHLERQATIATAKLMSFLLAWVAAFLLLPTWIPASALALWTAFVAPRIVEFHRDFQNEPTAEPAEALARTGSRE